MERTCKRTRPPPRRHASVTTILPNRKDKQMSHTPQASPTLPQQVFGMAVLNDWIASAIQVAAYYGIADLLQDGPKSIAELAAATQTHPDSLYRLLRALT